jgi:crossover junction endodeoxyribonuclease RuvC
MRVLGIDPGSRITGLGVVEDGADGLKVIAFNCIKMKNEPLPKRLGQIYRGVWEIISKHTPDVVAIEQVFVANNPKSALVLGQARGSAICAAVNMDRSVAEYSALQIKRAVVGSGNAKKEQVQHMVRALLGLTHTPQSDEADALACAICHLHTAQVQEKLRSAS